MWSEVHHDSQFSGYSVGAVSPHGSRILAFGNIRGALKLMKLEENGRLLVVMKEGLTGKVVDKECLATCKYACCRFALAF